MKKRYGKPRKLLGNAEGFTLLEAVISMAVFSIGILAMAALQTTAINSNTFAETVQDNTCEAMSQIEELMASDFDDKRIADNIEDCRTTSDEKYTICWDPDISSIPDTRRVIVTSTFVQNGVKKTIELKIIKPFIDVVLN